MRSREILGTATACSTGICVSRSLQTSSSCSTVCGTRMSKIWTMGTRRRAAPWCASGPVPAAPAAHPDRVAGNPGEGGGGFCRRGASYSSLYPSSRALSFLCPLEEWCLYSDRAIATLCHSCFSHERRRLSLQQRAAPSPSSRPAAIAASRE